MNAPSGHVALVFTDIQGSTALWESIPGAMRSALEIHNRVVREIARAEGGYEVKSEGDSFFIVFSSVAASVRFSLSVQEKLFTAEWPADLLAAPQAGVLSYDGLEVMRGLRVRIAIHAGDPECRLDDRTGRTDYLGPVVNRCARIMSSAHGGQTLMSLAAFEGGKDAVYDHAIVTHLGVTHLKDIPAGIEVVQLVPKTLAGRRFPELRDDLPELLKCAEGETLDFKRQCYDLTDQGGRTSFLVDLLSLTNTPRTTTAHLVLGVAWTASDGATVVGIAQDVDDNDFQTLVGDGRIAPRPRFTFSQRMHDGKRVGIIEIPVPFSGPCTPTRDLTDTSTLSKGAVYFRSGSKNDRAAGEELRRIIRWFAEHELSTLSRQQHDTWDRLLDALHHFNSRRTYFLASSSVAMESLTSIETLGRAPWRAALDFDPRSDSDGLLSRIHGELTKHRIVHRVARGEHTVQPPPGTHWFFARGLAGRADTVAADNHHAWVVMYKAELAHQLGRLRAAEGATPITVLILWQQGSSKAYLRTLLEEIAGVFREGADCVVVTDSLAEISQICEDNEARCFELSLRSLSAGVRFHFRDAGEPTPRAIPTASGAPLILDPSDALWIMEHLEIVDLGAGQLGDDSAAEFRHGAQPSWRNLHLQHDCRRDATQDIQDKVRASLTERSTLRINVYHKPGAGASTVGRRIAWNLRTQWPTVVLKHCDPRSTAMRLAKVTALTEQSVLILVDGGVHAEREVDDLYEALRALQAPAVMLQILRRFRRPKNAQRQYWMDSELSGPEADLFRNAYSIEAPHQRSHLLALSKSNVKSRRNPFFFGLTAFGRDFKGLPAYVEVRLASLTPDQRFVLGFLALAHYYGQQGIPAQDLALLLKVPKGREVEPERLFAGDAAPVMELLVEEPAGEWRIAHQLLAFELLMQLLAPGEMRERETAWKMGLSRVAKQFASFCRGDDQYPSERLLDLAHRVFIYRDNVELLGTERSGSKQFSQLIEDIPSVSGRLEVLRHAAAAFPNQAHFQAHLARFLGLNEEYDEALRVVDAVIGMQSDDNVLHHVRGMILRNKITSAIEREEALADVVAIANDASQSFETARRLSPDQEHGYVSEVQMLIRLVDYAFKVTKKSFSQLVTSPDTDLFLRNAPDRAEQLLDHVSQLYVMEKPSDYVLDCRARLQRMYGDYTKALQAWDSLLARSTGAKPPVRRQIVWTILRRRNGDWARCTEHELVRAQTLLEENLQEESLDTASLRLWLRAVRYGRAQTSLDSIIERVSYWKAGTGALDGVYYLYVLLALKALNGSDQALADSEEALEECRALARYRRDRARSFEWVGRETGIRALVHQTSLGDWKNEFWEKIDLLKRVGGTVRSIEGSHKGIIELVGGVRAFFVPGKTVDLSRDENVAVSCFVGFSYDGPKAWAVRRGKP